MAFTIWEWLILGFLVTMTIGIVGGLLSKRYYNKRWNFTYNLLEDSSGEGHSNIVGRGRCRLVKISDSGVEIFYVPKLNKYRAGYGRRSGPNHMVWGKDSSGYWHNIYFSSIDKKLEEIGVNIVSPQARLAEASIRKIVRENFTNKDFMTKYGTMITFGMLFLCIIALGVSQYLALQKLNEGAASNAKGAEIQKDTLAAQQKVIESTSALISKLDVMQSGGSGIIPVNSTA